MWYVEYDPGARVLTVRLTQQVTAANMRQIMRVHVQALSSTSGEPFRVLADLRGLAPLDREAATLFAEVKRAAAALPGYRGRAVLVDSATVALQQRRTSVEHQSDATELITPDEQEARSFLSG